VKNLHFDDGESLWDHLSNVQKRSYPSREYIYRGHADANWNLIPTIYRANPQLGFHQSQETTTMVEQQLALEFYLLKQFISGCDEVGITVPNDSIEFRDRNLSERKFEEYCSQPSLWPSNELIESMVMARLHGLPTRLLDWSRNPFVAVYFAVSEALRMQEIWSSDKRISIFILTIDKYLHDSNHLF